MCRSLTASSLAATAAAATAVVTWPPAHLPGRYLTGEASPDWPTVLDALGGTSNFYTDLGLIKGSDMEVVVPGTGG